MQSLKDISTNTKLCAVIGNPISHSLSPAIHNAAFKEKGLDFVYVAFCVEDLKNALAGMKALDNFTGMSVTIPHKIEALKYVDEVSDIDRQIGSINTIVKENNKLIGLSTDGPGAVKALVDAGAEINNKNILILGSGGAARAISFSLVIKSKPSELTILDINNKLLDELSNDLKNASNIPITSNILSDNVLKESMEKANIIINCTPVGMHPDINKSVIPKELFKTGQIIFDIVYTPFETKLLSDAKSCGLKIIHGVEMFVNQAVLQFERFTGSKAPEKVMKNIVMEHLNL